MLQKSITSCLWNPEVNVFELCMHSYLPNNTIFLLKSKLADTNDLQAISLIWTDRTDACHTKCKHFAGLKIQKKIATAPSWKKSPHWGIMCIHFLLVFLIPHLVATCVYIIKMMSYTKCHQDPLSRIVSKWGHDPWPSWPLLQSLLSPVDRAAKAIDNTVIRSHPAHSFACLHVHHLMMLAHKLIRPDPWTAV